MVMETTNDDYWKDFMVEGQRVRTISKDAKNNTRTIIFPYVEGKTLYDAIVKVHVKRLIMMDNTMSESLIKKHLLKPMPINLIKRNNKTTQLRRKPPATPSKSTTAPVEKESQNKTAKKMTINNRQVLKRN